jgi:hypothetical protein
MLHVKLLQLYRGTPNIALWGAGGGRGRGLAVCMEYQLSTSGKFGNAEYENKTDVAITDNQTPIIGHL